MLGSTQDKKVINNGFLEDFQLNSITFVEFWKTYYFKHFKFAILSIKVLCRMALYVRRRVPARLLPRGRGLATIVLLLTFDVTAVAANSDKAGTW